MKKKIFSLSFTLAIVMSMTWNAAAQIVPMLNLKAEIEDYFPIPSYTGGEVTVHDTGGKAVLKTRVDAGEKVNLSKLPAGEYHLRHGHRYIPIVKK